MNRIYNIEEINELTIDLHKFLSNEDNILRIVSNLNRNEQLESFLETIGCLEFVKPHSSYYTYKSGTIVVVGHSDVNKDILLGVAKKLGLDKNRFEMHLEYDDAKKFQYSKMQWAPTYSLVIVGPQGHSSVEKSHYGSAIAKMEQEEGYPPVLRSGRNNELASISKSYFKELLEFAIKERYIDVDYL